MQCRCDTAYRIICGMCQLASILDMFGLPAQDIILQALFQFLIQGLVQITMKYVLDLKEGIHIRLHFGLLVIIKESF